MNMVKERYCSYEVCKLLHEKGFDENTVFVWYEHLPKANAVHRDDVGKPKMGYFYLDETSERNFKFHNLAPIPPYINGKVYSAPTHQMACDWLRKVHKIFADPIKQGNYNDTREDYTYIVASNGTIYRNSSVCDKYPYEEAVEAALKYSLENLI